MLLNHCWVYEEKTENAWSLSLPVCLCFCILLSRILLSLLSFSARTLGVSEICSTVIDQSCFLDGDMERLCFSELLHRYGCVCIFYLTVSQVSLQLGDFLPQLPQLLLAGLNLLPLFSLLPLSLLLQPLDDSLLNTEKKEMRRKGWGEIVKSKRKS